MKWGSYRIITYHLIFFPPSPANSLFPAPSHHSPPGTPHRLESWNGRLQDLHRYIGQSGTKGLTGSRYLFPSRHLDGFGRSRFLDRRASVIVHCPHFARTLPRNEKGARLQGPSLHQHSRRLPQSLLRRRLNDHTLHFGSAVSLEFEDLAKRLQIQRSCFMFQRGEQYVHI